MFRPSGAYRAVNCTGSPQAAQRYPDTGEKAEAEEGTAAHEVAERILSSPNPPSVGTTTSNGVVVTGEMIKAVQVYVDDVKKIYNENPGCQFHLEEKITIRRVSNWYEGTPDAWLFNPNTWTVVLWDYKHGFKHVPVFENWQFISYAIGIVSKVATDLKLPLSQVDQALTVEFRVVQPRSFSSEGTIRTHRIVAHELRPYANRLQTAYEEASGKNPRTKAGPWCENCPARHSCATLRNAVYSIIDGVQALELNELEPDEISTELQLLERGKDLLDARLEGLLAEALGKLQAGAHIPGYGVGFGRGSVKWIKPVDELLPVFDLLGVGDKVRKPQEIITPTQAKQFIDPSVINLYSRKFDGAARVVRAKDTVSNKIFGAKS